MRIEQKSHVKNSIGRLMFAVLSVFLQIVWFFVLVFRLNAYSAKISIVISLLAVAVVVLMFRRDVNSSFKMSWTIVILAFPIFGLGIYFLLGRPDTTKGMRQRFDAIDSVLYARLNQSAEVFEEIKADDTAIANQCRYISDFAKCPVYKNTDVEYHPEASIGFDEIIKAVAKAKKFIFMEYHAIEDEESFKRLHDVLVKKAKEGVEVRILYDDMGSIFFINKDFISKMEADGIKCMAFNPVVPALRLFMNNRDHRKITVIDGEIAFTGGYNLANEYFNIVSPYGYWKDTGIRIQGDAVRSFTVMFLSMWNSTVRYDVDFEKYLIPSEYKAKKNGFVQPYADSPLDFERTGENVYLNLINNAKNYLYIMTPYLIITDEMTRAISLAAKRGVDVRIITPGIPDKKLVYKITRSYYSGLVRNGVKVFEYKPGFTHGKMCIADDVIATVGTINFDYRSLYHHFENGCLLYKCDAIKDIKADFEDTFSKCVDVTPFYNRTSRKALKASECIYRLFAPLL